MTEKVVDTDKLYVFSKKYMPSYNMFKNAQNCILLYLNVAITT